jgi:hypothetical protein
MPAFDLLRGTSSWTAFRLAIAPVLALIISTACALAGSTPPQAIKLGANFSLKAGELAQVAGQPWRIGFDDVTADSRCPKGERCVWAGEATVRVWLQQGAGPKEMRELRTTSGPAHSTRIADHELRLVRLEPYPITGKTIAKQDYVVTLSLAAGASTGSPAPDR